MAGDWIKLDADVVVFIHKETPKNTTTEEHSLIVAKHRHGRTGKLAVSFDGGKTTFQDINATAAASSVYGDCDVAVNGSRWEF